MRSGTRVRVALSGLGDPGSGLAFAFVPNLKRDYFAGDRRAHRLVEAAYAAIT